MEIITGNRTNNMQDKTKMKEKTNDPSHYIISSEQNNSRKYNLQNMSMTNT